MKKLFWKAVVTLLCATIFPTAAFAREFKTEELKETFGEAADAIIETENAINELEPAVLSKLSFGTCPYCKTYSHVALSREDHYWIVGAGDNMENSNSYLSHIGALRKGKDSPWQRLPFHYASANPSQDTGADGRFNGRIVYHLKYNDSAKAYLDCRNSVFIDWDGTVIPVNLEYLGDNVEENFANYNHADFNTYRMILDSYDCVKWIAVNNAPITGDAWNLLNLAALYRKHDIQVSDATIQAYNYASPLYETITVPIEKKFSIHDETDPDWADLSCLAVEMLNGVY